MARRDVPGWRRYLLQQEQAGLLARFGTNGLDLHNLTIRLNNTFAPNNRRNWLFLTPEAVMRQTDPLWPDEALKLYRVGVTSIEEPDGLKLHGMIPYYLSFDEKGVFVEAVAPYAQSKNGVIENADLQHLYFLNPARSLAVTGVVLDG